MCGARLESELAPAARPAGREEPRRRVLPDEGISGPSFLGLNAPAKERSSYLLEDEPPPRRWRNYVLLLILMVVGGLIWMQWRSTLKAQIARIGALATQPAQPAPPPSPQEPDVSVTDQSQAAGSGQQQKSETETALGTSPTPSAERPVLAGSDQQGQPGKESKSAMAGSEGAAAGALSIAEKEPAPKPTPDAHSEPKSSATRHETDADGMDAEGPPTRARSAPPPEDDSVLVLAQKYLHGRGVQQNCEQGMIYLRRALQQPSAKARSQLGALYATGHCVPEDRVEAYRWFTSALELDPNNVWLERQRDALFARMTSQERQRAR
jgi:hypothetical protein